MKPPAFAIDSAEEARDEESALQMTGRWTARRGKKPPKQSNRPQSKWHSKGRKPFQVVHLSDVHIDRQYLVSDLSVFYFDSKGLLTWAMARVRVHSPAPTRSAQK